LAGKEELVRIGKNFEEIRGLLFGWARSGGNLSEVFCKI
jgi:hypothetical protein